MLFSELMNNPALINSNFALINSAFFSTRVHSVLFLPCFSFASLFLPPSQLRVSPHSVFRRGERKRPPSRLSKGRSWWRAREQRQRSSRQINLRRDLRPRTSLSLRICTRAHLRASRVRSWPYRSGAIVHRSRFRGCVELNDEKRRMDQLLPILP